MEASLEDHLDLEAFAHVVAHDLGAPLRGISIHLRLLERSLAEDDAARERIDLLQSRLRQMDGMLRRIRAFSRLEGQATPGPTALAEAVQECWDRIGAERHTLRIAGDGSTSGGPLLVQMVLGELLRNAVEHDDRDAGEVIVRIEDATVTIEDAGPGLPEAPEVLWQPFAKAGSAIEDGRGAGLALARHVAHRLGGDLHLHSAGRGTTATVTLPA